MFTSLATNGLLIGTAVAVAMDLPNPTLLALVGMGAFLGAGYRIPLAGAGLIIMMCGRRCRRRWESPGRHRDGDHGFVVRFRCPDRRRPARR